MPYQNKRNQTKQKIQDAFITLYRERDITKISVRDVCEVASINRSTFYVYYDDIFDLQEAIETELMSQISERISPILMNSKHPFDANRLIETMLQYSHELDDLPQLIIRRSNSLFISRLLVYVTSFLESRFGELSQSAREQLVFCLHYHLSGVIAVLNAVDQNVLPWTIDQTVERVGQIAGRGAINLIHESVMDQSRS